MTLLGNTTRITKYFSTFTRRCIEVIDLTSNSGHYRHYLEAVVSVGVVVAVQVPISGGVINVAQIEVHALLTVFGGHSSNLASGRSLHSLENHMSQYTDQLSSLSIPTQLLCHTLTLSPQPSMPHYLHYHSQKDHLPKTLNKH